jgi:hypothetical protein
MKSLGGRHSLPILVLLGFCAALPLCAQPCVRPDAGLVAWWPGDGNTNDIVGNHHGTLRGGSFSAGKVSQAFDFTGKSDFLDVPNTETLNVRSAITIEAWIKPHIWNGNARILQKGNGDDQYFLIGDDSGRLRLQLKGVSSPDLFGVLPGTGTWHHVAATYDGSLMKLFLDGGMIAWQVATGLISRGSGGNLAVGRKPDGGSYEQFDGLIDEVAIYSRALSDSEILTIANAGSAGKCKGPQIVLQPQSQIAMRGTSVLFSVGAIGTPPLSYRWHFNGQTIGNAVGALLTIDDAHPTNGGRYQVEVSSPLGAILSAAATLAVLAEPGYGTTPSLPTYALSPAQEPGKDGLIVVTHGFALFGWLTDVDWINQMAASIQERVPANWQVSALDWTGAAGLTPSAALIVGVMAGNRLGRDIENGTWKHVHLIGHSAGAALIDAAAHTIKAGSSSIVVHTTFLDPYVSILLAGRHVYGSASDWSDSYFSRDLLTFGPLGFTEGALHNAYNVDVTRLDPQLHSGLSSHAWPHDFYQATITNASYASGYGFPFSNEGGSWGEATNRYAPGNSPYTFGEEPSVPQGNVPITRYGIASFTDLPALVSANGMVEMGGPGFAATTGRFTRQPSNLSVGAAFADTIAVWLATGVIVTNLVNFVTFEAQFTNEPVGTGVFSVYWNTNQIGLLDERTVLAGLQSYSFALPQMVTNGTFALGFRLDAFSNSISSITVTNVQTGFAGVMAPVTLRQSRTNNMLALTLMGAAGYSYLLQASSNLLDWTPIATLVNTNGEVQFTDSEIARLGHRFYRALSP